jgi:hypothetical protein
MSSIYTKVTPADGHLSSLVYILRITVLYANVTILSDTNDER